MFVNFSEALRTLGGNAAVVRIANAARPAGNYLFNTILPERNTPGYTVKSGSMTIRPTMAGMVGMDSVYPPSGITESSTFMENVAKIANETVIPEAMMRQVQEWAAQLILSGQPTNAFVLDSLLNFLQTVVLQPQLDRMEWLRGQALATNGIDWSFNQKDLVVSYGIPAANIFTTRTSTAAYGGSASAFWSDIRAMRAILRDLRVIIMHPDLLDDITTNDVNQLEVLNQSENAFTVRRLVGSGTNLRASTDARDTVTLIAYGDEGEVFDLATPGLTKKVPFMPKGPMVGIGTNRRTGFVVGQGSVVDPADGAGSDVELGYTHIGPTIEAGGISGRWAEIDVPADRPWQTRGRAVSNGLPVIEAPHKIVIASSAIT